MKTKASQRGATLVVALIFLVLMSLFAISAFNSSSGNLRIVGNTQARQESLSAAELAVEQIISAISYNRAITSPLSPAEVDTTPIQVDIDGNGVADYTAMVTPVPQCYRPKPIPVKELPAAPKDPSVTDTYRDCRNSVPPGGPEYDNPEVQLSGCSNSEWNIRAEVTDARTSTKVAVNQGISVVIPNDQESSFCK